MNELKLVRGTVTQYKEKFNSLKTASNEVKNIHNNTIYFVYEVNTQNEIIPQSGRIYIGDIEFSRPSECITDLTFIASDTTQYNAIIKQD